MYNLMHKMVIFILILTGLGCYSTDTYFIKHGYDTYPAKPENYDVLVFETGEEPDQEFEVIGLVVFDGEAGLLFSGEIDMDKIIERLKVQARRNGADAIMDIRIQQDVDIGSGPDISEVGIMKRCQAKAIVFK